jgi:hypothetical protein
MAESCVSSVVPHENQDQALFSAVILQPYVPHVPHMPKQASAGHFAESGEIRMRCPRQGQETRQTVLDFHAIMNYIYMSGTQQRQRYRFEETVGMTDEARYEAIRRALDKAVKRTPLSLFGRLTPEGETVAERLTGHLENGTEIVFESRTSAVQRTDALMRKNDGTIVPLADGEYRLRDGPVFRVVDGQIDFEAVFSDPDGTEPFREYHAWHEVVAIENPLLSLADPSEITDVIRFVAPDENSYYAVQHGVGQSYQAFVAERRELKPLTDGEYPLPGGRSFRVEAGDVHPDSLGELKVYAYQSTRLPR